MRNSTIITNDLEKALLDLRGKNQNTLVFEAETFDIESAHEVISAAYFASQTKKTLILKATTYSEISQNALLKLVEESPPNIEIIFLGRSRALFLPTILSRTITKTMVFAEEKKDFVFDYDGVNKAVVLDFVKKNRYLTKDDAHLFLDSALAWARQKPFVDKSFLDFLYRAKRLLGLNSNAQNIVIDLFLHIIRMKNYQKNK